MSEYVTYTIYFRIPGSDGSMKLDVEATPKAIEAYANEAWDRLKAGGFELLQTRYSTAP